MTDQRASHLPAVPMSAQQQHERQQQQAAAIERAKLRARKPTDKTMPEGVEDCILGDGVQRYRDLRDFERRLDATITRKRLDVVDSVGRHVKVGDYHGGCQRADWTVLTSGTTAIQDPAHMDYEHRRGPSLAESWTERG